MKRITVTVEIIDDPNGETITYSVALHTSGRILVTKTAAYCHDAAYDIGAVVLDHAAEVSPS